MTRTTRTLAALLLALALTACGGEAVPRAGATAAPASASPSAPATSAATSPPPAAPSAAAPASAGARASFPPAAERVVQGGRVWAVYLGLSRLTSGGSPEDPQALAQSKVEVEAVGYRDRVVAGDVDCDRGAREALKLDAGREYAVTSLFFDTEAQARQFVAAYREPVVGLAQITALCLD